MAVTFVAAGSFAGNATVATQAITAPACAANDILICAIINKSATANAVSPPDGTWTAVIATEVNDCTTAADDHQYSLYWKRATGSGGSFTFTKATDDNVLFGGVIVAYRGCPATGSPLDATAAVRTETVGAADNVTFPAYDPTSTDVRVIFVAYYGNDATTFAAAMSNDVNPDCTIDVDVESATGNDCSIAITSGTNDGSNVASRTWASAATADAGNTGVVFALKALELINVAPAVVAIAAVIPAPTITASATPAPSAVAITAVVPAASVDIPTTVAASTVAVTAVVPSPTITASATVKQIGYLNLTGAAGSNATSPDSTALDLTGDYEIIVHAEMNGSGRLVSKYDSTSAGQSSFELSPLSATRLRFTRQRASDGQQTIVDSAVFAAAGQKWWVRAVGTGTTVTLYSASDQDAEPSSWTQIGIVTGQSVPNVLTNLQLAIGSNSAGNNRYTGRIYRVIIRDGPGGSTVFDARFDEQASGTTSFNESSSNAATVTVNSPASILGGLVAISAVIPTPTITATAAAAPATVAIAAVIGSPTISISTTASPAVVAVVAVVDAPTIDVPAGTTVEPSTVALTAVVDTPTITASATPAPAVVLVTVVVDSPTIAASGTPSPPSLPIAVVVDSPTIAASGTASPAAVAVTVVVDNPSLAASAVVTPAAVAVDAAVQSPSITTTATASPAAVAVAAVIDAPTITATSIVTPAVVTIDVVVDAPSISAAATADPSVVPVDVVIPSPTVIASALVSIAVVTIDVVVDAPSIAAAAVAAPNAVSVTAAIDAVTISASALVAPGVVVVVVVIDTPVPQTGTSATATPAVVAIVAAVDAPTILGTGNPAPAVVAVVVAIGATGISASSTVLVGVVVPIPGIGGGSFPPIVAIQVVVPPPAIGAGAITVSPAIAIAVVIGAVAIIITTPGFTIGGTAVADVFQLHLASAWVIDQGPSTEDDAAVYQLHTATASIIAVNIATPAAQADQLHVAYGEAFQG